jgi:hypothetical protein
LVLHWLNRMLWLAARPRASGMAVHRRYEGMFPNNNSKPGYLALLPVVVAGNRSGNSYGFSGWTATVDSHSEVLYFRSRFLRGAVVIATLSTACSRRLESSLRVDVLPLGANDSRKRLQFAINGARRSHFFLVRVRQRTCLGPKQCPGNICTIDVFKYSN